MKKQLLLAAALATLSTTTVAGPDKGDWEIVFTNMGAGFATDGDNTVLGASVRAGYFLSSNHEVGFGASLGYIDTDAGSEEILGLAGFYRHNWATPQSSTWWYAGVDLDILDLQEAGDTMQLRPHFGRKWMLNDSVSFDFNVGIDIDVDNSDADPVFDAMWGITVFFK